MSEIVRGHKHAFNVILPKRVTDTTDDDLRLILVTLKNAVVAGSVHISKIENELRKRGVTPRILSSARSELLSNIEIDDETGDVEWNIGIKEGKSAAT